MSLQLVLSRARKLAAIVGVFMFAGPPIGGVVLALCIPIITLLSGDLWGSVRATTSEVVFVPYAAIFSYPFGLLPATFAGLVVGTTQLTCGKLSWPVVLLIGVGAGIVDADTHQQIAIYLLSGGSVHLSSSLQLSEALFLVMVCAIATVICWRFVRSWYMQLGSPEQHPA